MISFKQYITEARAAPLYHGTSRGNITAILLNREGIYPRTSHRREELLMKTDKYDDRLMHGVSTSRSFNYAAGFKDKDIVLELDQQKLLSNYKIVPIQYWQGSKMKNAKIPAELHRKFPVGGRNNEFEEFIITGKNIPVKYITRMYVPQRIYDSAMKPTQQIINQIAEKYGRDFIRTYDDNDII